MNSPLLPASAPPIAHLRTRPVAVGHWRAFLAVARHLNFRAAAEELALTQSAVSRQIQALEDEVGVPLFLRHTRAVELTSAGGQLQRAVAPALERMDAAVRLVRQTAGRKSVAITTWASFASMWLIPRMEEFQRDNPDIDIRIDATDTIVDLETADVDLALRSSVPGTQTAGAQRLFGEQLAVVASPWLLNSMPPIRTPADVAQFTLIEAGDAHRMPYFEWITWRRWFELHGLGRLQPKRWLYFNYAQQIVQAALAGQGLALARMPLIAESLASGDLQEVLPGHRLDSPLVYWLVVGPRSGQRPEIQAFSAWLLLQAEATRQAVGEVPDTDLNDDIS
ncbi:LysR family transcriptional regulator [Diaphorobacter nitroreducens]|uniref:LysR substrate-binding domain-containing protein n=1 Tax=Diaphorobacter nitroreducens TaxID=164759 RepID=UPI000B5A1F91|nr:LysR substrate-binding domain-containing protein [Diaphorobacter nitroreducens]ASI69154.1 LysR family transcriptional regulator [Diaphorobacter nitroreducens]